MKILITGGTGFIGSKVVDKLKKKHQIIVFLRTQKLIPGVQVIKWDYKDPLPDIKVDGIIHLMGKNILDSWTNKNKKEIYNSRIIPLKKFQKKYKLKFLISASAQAIYPNGDKVYDETSPISKKNTFLTKLCKDWERYARKVNAHRVVNLRISMVLGKQGFLKKIIPVFKYYMGGYINPEQRISWIHVDDLVKIIIYCVENNVNGPVNCAAGHTTYKKFTNSLAKALKRPNWVRIPKFLVMLLGERSELFLASIAMKSKLNIKWKYSKLDQALRNLIN